MVAGGAPQSTLERSCTLLVHFDKATPTMAGEVREALETGSDEQKVDAMRKAVMLLLNGESISNLFITIVRYVLPSEDHTVQKLLLLYLEILEKTDASGNLLPEMILICQNLRNNLQHPNEYIRGCTLRFICRVQELELLEPLIPSIVQNLDHRHSFVRRHAVLAISTLYRLPGGDQLLADMPERIEEFLQGESDVGARRNAFNFLCHSDQERAVRYLFSSLDQIPNWGDILQMAVLDLVRKVCRSSSSDKSKFIKIILALISSASTAVVYECANSLVTLSQAPTAIRAAANCYCQLLISQSDNNVRLIVLDRLAELKTSQPEIMQDLVMDIMRALSAPNLDIRRKTLDITLDLLTTANIEEVVMALKKEVVKSGGKDDKSISAEYRQMLVQAIHVCAVKFPEVGGSVVHLLMDFLSDSNTASALDVVYFVREIIETNPSLRGPVIERLLDTFYQIRASRVCACALWIMGEYCVDTTTALAAIEALKSCLGSTVFVSAVEQETEQEDTSGAKQGSVLPPTAQRPMVLADGTYATQSAVVEAVVMPSTVSSAATPNLRALLLSGDFFLAAVISTTFTKLVLRIMQENSLSASEGLQNGWLGKQINAVHADAMLYLVSFLRLGESSAVPHTIDFDSKERILLCLRILMDPEDRVVDIWLKECRSAFASMVADKMEMMNAEAKAKETQKISQPDDLIDFYHLKSRRGMSQLELEDEVQDDLGRATGMSASGDPKLDGNALSRVLQLTGFSDPVYAEASVIVHQYDIVLDVTVLNRSKETMQNLCLELSTMGDLKLVERPQNYTLGPGHVQKIRANIKVSSTETGVIFGNIVYESTAHADRAAVVVLNDIHIDIMDYILPATCPDVAFRNMWAEFEWENKVAINSSITDVRDFLDHIVKSTNMKCLTPPAAVDGECGFLAANLYAKSVFGEDALVNVSVEKQNDGKLAGNIRIRSKTQGIALSLGDKITLKQKGS